MKKTLILHDTFLYRGGGERLIMMMARILSADIASGFFSRESFDLKHEGIKGELIPIAKESLKKGLRHLYLKWAFLFKTKFIRQYNTVIFSGDSISAVRNCRDTQRKIYYCHTPPRYLYDLKDQYIAKVPLWKRPIFLAISWVFRHMYEYDIHQMDILLTNSANTRSRIQKYLGLDATILYPPVSLEEFRYVKSGDYYLSVARLADAKRVDRIIEAFRTMPEKKLIIVYGENDPQKEKVQSFAKNLKNVQFKTFPGNIGFKECVGSCIASIYIPIDEDFGMIPIESMAAGKPVIGVAEGGLRETIIDGKTGILIPPGANIIDIRNAVEKMTPEIAKAMRGDCEKRASEFSVEVFEKNLRKIVDR